LYWQLTSLYNVMDGHG